MQAHGTQCSQIWPAADENVRFEEVEHQGVWCSTMG